jgi:GT2 family glycosyltransferase
LKPDRQRGLDSYAKWRRQESRRSRGISTSSEPAKTSFLIVIESDLPSGTGKETEGDSTARQPRVRQITARQGEPIAKLVADATEDFVLLLRRGDRLAAGALDEIAKQHRVDPALKVISFDRDRITSTGEHVDPVFLPQWSPEMLLGANYFDRAVAISASLLRQNVADEVLGDRGVWAVLLRAELSQLTCGHIPHVLLSSPREPRALTALDAEMVARVLAEKGERAETCIDGDIVRVRFIPENWPSVSIIVPTRHSRANLQRLLPSLSASDYPEFDVQIIDNGGYSPENEEWYQTHESGLKLDVIWWHERPFNYSRVNNAAIAATRGDVIVMLNDDTQIVDPGWLKEVVGLLLRDGIGTVGVQHLQGDGLIQHGGVMIGPGGSADNLFAGLRPKSQTIIGPTAWYRNVLAVTGACVAVRRRHYEEVGGLDERFVLCGSDVVFGLDQVLAGRRNAVVPFDVVRHYESITRGADSSPIEDYFASYWRYHPWLSNGDPYVSPNVSPLSSTPTFRNASAPSPVEVALAGMGRPVTKVVQNMGISAEAYSLLATASVTRRQVQGVRELHESNSGPLNIRTINWFIPDIDMPFFGGLNTAFRLADKLAREHGVLNRFVVLGPRNELYIRSALAAAFPSLGNAEIVFYEGSDEEITSLPRADVAVATLWLTAMHVAKASGVKRKFYLMQDYEPGFYPASSMYAMAEESYRLGLYGICNTESMYRIYEGMYHGEATYFTPAVDRSVYNAVGRREKDPNEPVTVFAYARDHFRNCWELVYSALTEVKRIHGNDVRIVAAGARYLPPSADFIDMGLLDYRATGAVYRETDIGVTMQISRHPSYLPLELMASGVPMVAPDSDWFHWLFKDGENSLLAMRTYDDLVERIDTLVRQTQLRRRLQVGALRTIDEGHSDWDTALSHIWDYMRNPDAQ